MTTENEMKSFISKKLGSKFCRCLWPFEECKKDAIKAHSIQNQRILEQLEHKGHVIMPKMKMDFKRGPQVSFNTVGRNIATTFTGLCKDHDNILFAPIDDNEIDTGNKEHLFLLAYRSVLKESHASMKAAHDIQSTYTKGIDLGKFNPNEQDLPMLMATEKLMAAYTFYLYKCLFDKILYEKSFEKVVHREFVINTSAPTLAVSSVFSTDKFSAATGGLAFIILNIYPSANKTIVVFSYLIEHVQEAQTIFNHLLFADQHYLMYEISKIVLKKCENMVLSPKVFDTFSQEQIKCILRYFRDTAIDPDILLEDHRLFLFGAQ